MVLFTLCFTIGVWLLQQQSVLPGLGWAWLPAMPLILFRSFPDSGENGRIARFAYPVSRAMCIAAFALGLGFFVAAWQAQLRLSDALPDAWQGRDIEITGVVADLPRRFEHGLHFRFDVENVLTPQARVPRHVYLSTYHDRKSALADLRAPDPRAQEVRAGERWRLTVRLKQPHGSSNPYGFDFELRALENDVRAVGYVDNRADNRRLSAQADGLGYRIEGWREAVRDKFNAALGDAPYAGVLNALAIGDQSSIPAAQWQVFTRTGVNHLMSISGLHITMLASLAFALVYWLWRRSTRLTLLLPARKAAATAAVLAAIGYALLSGFAVPAQRTVYMAAAVAVALWLNRSFTRGQILCIAALGVLVPDPWAVLSPGFWLSFGAVAMILYVTAYRLKPSHWLVEYGKVQWAMTIGLIPILLGLFQQVSLVSPVANAFAIPLVSLVVVPPTLLGAVLPTHFCGAPLWLAHTVMNWTMWLLERLNELPQAVWTQHAPPLWSIGAGMLGVLWVLLPRGFPGRWMGVLLLLPMFLNAPQPPAPDNLRLIIFDVGQGLAVAAQTRHHALVYDTGPDFSDGADSGNRLLVPALRAMGISALDGLILTHDDTDHTGGAASLMRAMPIGWASSSLPEGHPLLQLTSDKRHCMDGQAWRWDGADFEILHPDPGSYRIAQIRDNNRGCVLRISIGNQHVLLTADIEKDSERQLLERHADKLPATLLVVPHHGSKTSSTAPFIAAVHPRYAVFTVGYRNRFGHPNAAIENRYADSGSVLLRSDADGAILVDMDAQGLRIERYRQTHRRYWMHNMQLPGREN